ncbi:uncharacterized protein [Spinacia oleracea]|uniref:Uncharacterized protein n=1 Tax=Spinacia oleracea TaxID=3562 RepID=A0ABM3RI78_SPIOL|nr:uncharacterized protein LOC130469837 [Spinacia oleracea]
MGVVTKGSHGVTHSFVPSSVVKSLNLVDFEFNLRDLDVISGMDWLSLYKDKVECEIQKTFREIQEPLVISVMQVRKLMKKECALFFGCVLDVSKEVRIKIEDIPIVNEFMDVFPSKIAGMPHARAVESPIDLVPRTTPISKASHRMTSPEIKEL